MPVCYPCSTLFQPHHTLPVTAPFASLNRTIVASPTMTPFHFLPNRTKSFRKVKTPAANMTPQPTLTTPKSEPARAASTMPASIASPTKADRKARRSSLGSLLDVFKIRSNGEGPEKGLLEKMNVRHGKSAEKSSNSAHQCFSAGSEGPASDEMKPREAKTLEARLAEEIEGTHEMRVSQEMQEAVVGIADVIEMTEMTGAVKVMDGDSDVTPSKTKKVNADNEDEGGTSYRVSALFGYISC